MQLHVPESFEHAVARRLADLTAYQDADYARQYQDVVERVAARERELAPDAKPRLALAVARSLFKLMAYKDEYEVARLYTGDAFRAQLRTSSKANTACASTWRRRSSRARIRAPACRAR